ncbi:CUB domain-containing protein 1 [Tiliqua scincoides]|uniref:CUB domain-containing protein 1 n=1 Tax=Tiliqua scincoides TaxID=71010 RepID=UPI0034621452
MTINITFGGLDPKSCPMSVGKISEKELQINPGERKDVTFSCSTPEKYWKLLIVRKIDCTAKSCALGDILLQPELPRLNRTFVWDVKAKKAVGLLLKFSTGLTQMAPNTTCSEPVTYRINSRIDENMVEIGSFCINGSVSQVKVQERATVTLNLPAHSKRTTSGLTIDSGPAIKKLCIIESVFRGESSTVLMSANYPLGFPNDQLMTWHFDIPVNLRAYVVFLNYTKATCKWREQKVEYYLPGSYSKGEVYSLSDAQPVNIPGTFNFSLQGCDQEPQSVRFLSLIFKVVVQYPQNEKNVTHTIDLRHEKNINVTIYSKKPHAGYHLMNEPFCLICRGAKNCGSNITLFSGDTYTITFLCKNIENLRIIAEQSIACWNIRLCQMRTHFLLVPRSLTDLPIQIETFTWKLTALENINIELKSPQLKLKQFLPDQRCNGSYSYAINGTTPGKVLSLGTFCPGRLIEKIHIKNNVTITLRTFGNGFANDSKSQDLQMYFTPATRKDYIFTVSPDRNSVVLLQTPNWLEGLLPHATVSWNISIPPQQFAQLTFLQEWIGVTCESGEVNVHIEEQRPNPKKFTIRDDQKLPKTVDLYHHFWVNITNCKPDAKRGLCVRYKVQFFQKKTGLAAIIGAVVGGIVGLAAIGLLVCCIKKKSREKRENQTPMVGVYNCNVNTQMPGKEGMFKKGRKNNESHVYAVIEDAMVYGHLLDSSSRPETAEIGVYRPFTGPVSTTPPSPPPIRKASKVPEVEESSLVPLTDNETYTFAHRTPEELKGKGDADVSGNGSVGKCFLENDEQEHSVERL